MGMTQHSAAIRTNELSQSAQNYFNLPQHAIENLRVTGTDQNIKLRDK